MFAARRVSDTADPSRFSEKRLDLLVWVIYCTQTMCTIECLIYYTVMTGHDLNYYTFIGHIKILQY